MSTVTFYYPTEKTLTRSGGDVLLFNAVMMLFCCDTFKYSKEETIEVYKEGVRPLAPYCKAGLFTKKEIFQELWNPLISALGVNKEKAREEDFRLKIKNIFLSALQPDNGE